MFQNMIADHISVLDKSLQGGLTVPITQSVTLINNDSQVLPISASGGTAFQIGLDVSTNSSHVLVSLELAAYLSSSDPSLDQFTLWARTVKYISEPTTANTGTDGDWFVFDELFYGSAEWRYGTLKTRFLVPNLSGQLVAGESQYVQVALLSTSGEVMNGQCTFKMRAHVDEYQFLQPMK